MARTIGFILALVLGVCVLAGAKTASADRSIVFGARFYLKPGSSGKSHSHIYRVNPDGRARRQLTRGPYKDSVPKWSPDGKRIVFTRQNNDIESLCVVGSNGGNVRTLAVSKSWEFFWNYAWSPRGDYLAYLGELGKEDCGYLHLVNMKTGRDRRCFKANDLAWSPDGKSVYGGARGIGGCILDVSTGKVTKLPGYGGSAVWQSNDLLVVEKVDKPDEAAPVLGTFDRHGRLTGEVTLDMNGDSDFPIFADSLYAVPGNPGEVVYGEHCGDSTGGRSECLLRTNLRTGKTRTIVEGQYLAWSPDGKRFCTGSSRNLADFGKLRNGAGYQRQVWTSTLSVVSARDGTSRTIVSGLVMVAGCDWRKR